MTEKEDFNLLVTRAVALQGRGNLRPAIAKELLHYDILFALDQAALLDKLTFQGGTALRLCYGAARYSEDLDFVGGPQFNVDDLTTMKSCLENYIGERYGLEITVKEPNETSSLNENQEIKVSKWQISIVTEPQRKDLPKQKIKIDVANVSAYTRQPRQLQRNYEFLPDGYRDTVVLVESLEEIMADKLVSFVCSQKYIRHRDIWDLQWLKSQGVALNSDFLSKKITDYRIEDYPARLAITQEKLPEIVSSRAFKDELLRFIEADVVEQKFEKSKSLAALTLVMNELLLQVEKAITV